MKTLIKIVILLSVVACGPAAIDGTCAATSSCPEPTPVTSDAGTSVCVIPSIGGFGSECTAFTPDSQSWVWMNTSQAGEQTHRCNVNTCPTGATCVVQSDMSGKDDGGQLLMGTCQ